MTSRQDHAVATAPLPNSPAAALKAVFAAIVGADHVRDDEASLRLHSEDIYEAAALTAMLIVAPGSLDELSDVVAAAHEARVAIAPRGGGMSYTASYLPQTDTTVSLDMRRMNRVLAISAEDMTVTVEGGCTWLALNEALKPLGLRTPFWGPMSGIYSTIGGGLSQGNAMFGAGHYGTSTESMIALTMVLGDGRVLRTGARGPDGDTPFYRHYGPDVAGLFCGDSGTLGIKAEVTLRLIRIPPFEDYASFSFKSGEALLRALAEIARAGIACETCGFDPGLTKVRMRRMSLLSDVKTLGAVLGKQGNLGKGLLAAAKVALGGRNFIAADDYPLHIVAEGRSKEGVAADIAAARAIAKRFDGVETPNSIARVIRAMPFPVPNSMLGPDGESWAPVHGMVSLSNGPAMFADIQAMFAAMAPEFAAHGITTGYLFTSLSTNALTIEPVFFWPHGYRPVHASLMDANYIAGLPKLAANPAATAVVSAARAGVKAITRKYGGAHFQIGRAYDYRASRDEATCELLDTVKAFADPDRQFNPGGLGFGP
ncbi:FAD-binding oxidoreductase [Glacieibacterium frigidum]|uniref:FAD-binding oxidoreductase n=1 Tax=Glacieibacterium frigidum TaxID=2593303 RepID=A0A552U898_9SPHN|nr:FAD-binding oxidoreductase [Glacieibacterium frigidum]TRW14445.1 FAD-binding oxidoreductase [Glacieibacterium frigidum]